MHSVCLSVSPPVCAHSNCRKYLLNVFKFIYAVHIVIEWTILKMICMEINVRLQRHAKFFDTFRPIGSGGVFKVYCNGFILH